MTRDTVRRTGNETGSAQYSQLLSFGGPPYRRGAAVQSVCRQRTACTKEGCYSLGYARISTFNLDTLDDSQCSRCHFNTSFQEFSGLRQK